MECSSEASIDPYPDLMLSSPNRSTGDTPSNRRVLKSSSLTGLLINR